MDEHYIIKGETLTNIADAIREKTGKTDNINPKEIASGINEVYEAGYDSFWKAYQANGNYIMFAKHMFSGVRWNDATFYPISDIKLKGNSSYTFYYNNVRNLRERLNEQNVKIVLFEVKTMSYFFMEAVTKEIPTINMKGVTNVTRFVRDCRNLITIPAMDFSTCTNFDYFANGCTSLKTVELINFSSATTILYAFGNCPNLENITIEGTIPISISFSQSPLTVESMKSVISHLKDYAGTENSGKYTLTLKDSCKTLMAEQGAIEEFGNKTYDQYITDIGWNLA